MVSANALWVLENVGQWPVLAGHIAVFMDRIPALQMLMYGTHEQDSVANVVTIHSGFCQANVQIV